jgi:hypothetical protein
MNETFRMPRTHDEAQRALSMRRVTGEQRTVAWHHFTTRRMAEHRRDRLGRDHYLINVKPGNELTVHVYSGLPFLEVESGHVTVVFQC